MPGLIGFLQKENAETASRRVERMARALEPEDRFRRELHAEAGMGFGRVGLGILNPEPQPVWSPDRQVGIVMDGELFDTEPLRRRLRAAVGPGDAALVLRLYLAHGRRFAAMLNGAFLIAIWDRRNRTLTLANDRLGLHPVYYAETRGGLLFGSGLRALLREPEIRRKVDAVAVAEFLTFDHPLGPRSLLQDVHLLPQGTLLTARDGSIRLRSYWQPTFPRTYPVRKDADYSDELIALLRQAVRRQAPDGRSAAILLSGGLDSRSVLAALAEVPGDGMTTMTWGIPGSDDERYARESARLAKMPHHAIPLSPDWLPHLASKGSGITGGLGNLLNLHALAVAEPAGARAPILYKGFLGDAMFGFGMRPRHWADYDDATRLEAHLEAYRDYNVLTFDFPSHGALFTRDFRRAVGEGVTEDYRYAMQAADSPQLSDQRLYIDLTQRLARMTINGVESVRDRAAVRLPFADNDLLDFSLRVPPGLRYGRQVMVQGFIRAFPAYAQIPFTPSGLPLMACARDVLRRGTMWAQWHLRRAGLGRLAGPTVRPVKDYGRWMRTVLRPWVEATLLSNASLERGYFQPAEIRRLVQEHMNGVDHTVRLGALLSLESFHREYLD